MPQGYDTQWTAPAANHVWLPSVPQRVRGIGVAAAIALLITSFFYLMDLVYPLAASALVGRAAESEDVDLLNLTWSMELPLLLLIAIGTLTTAVLVIVWLYRARKNLDVMNVWGGLGPGWAIGGWFIPIGNLFLPGRILTAVSRGSLNNRAGLAYLWWTGWVVGICGGQAARVFDRAQSADLPDAIAGPSDFQLYIDYYQDSFAWYLPGMAGMVVAGVALALLILRVSQAQEAWQATPPASFGRWTAPDPAGGATIG